MRNAHLDDSDSTFLFFSFLFIPLFCLWYGNQVLSWYCDPEVTKEKLPWSCFFPFVGIISMLHGFFLSALSLDSVIL